MLNTLAKLTCTLVAAAFTVMLMLTEPVSVPEVPVTVTVEVPVAAVALAARVKTLLPEVGLVANEAVTPVGRPVAARVTLPVKPLAGTMAMVLTPLLF